MPNIKVKKILLSIFFIISILLVLIILKISSLNNFTDKSLVIFIMLLLSILFLYFFSMASTKEELKLKKQNIVKTLENQGEVNKPAEVQDNSLKTIENLLKNIKNVNSIVHLGGVLLKNFADEFSIMRGIFYHKNVKTKRFEISHTYAGYNIDLSITFTEAEGITGQVALNKKPEYIQNISEGVITVVSGLGSTSLTNLLVIPFVYNNETIALIEVSAFEEFPKNYIEIWNKINKPISEKLIKLIENE